MKKILIIFGALAVLFTACETDFNVNAAWEETIVVYGLLDASTDTQYIRINKAYLGEGDAIRMAQYPDSINFNPSSLDVIIYKLESNNDTTDIVQLDTMLIIKDSLDVNGNPGLFSIENNIIYSAVFPSTFFTSGNNYAIWIRNLDSGNQVWATTEVISDFSFKNTNLLINFPFGFYNPDLPDTSRVLSKTIEWNKSVNGTIYQLDLIFNYLENGILKSLVWSQPLEYSEGGPTMQSKLEGEKLFNFLSQNLTPDVNVIREFTYLDLVMTVGTENLETYIKVNEPITGISQQRPSFTNINNGIGIFSSRFTHIVNNLDLSDDTKDYLINELGRNFQ